jgi:hypothetical protein
MSKRPSYSGDGAVAYIGVWPVNSFLDSETLREKGDSKRAPRFKVQSSKFGPKRRAGIQN